MNAKEQPCGTEENGRKMAQYLTKREHFAAMAMQGWRANPVVDKNIPSEAIAEWSLEDADALLAALDKEGAK